MAKKKIKRKEKKKKEITAQSTLNYPKISDFCSWGTPEKQLQRFSQCKVVTVGNLPRCTKLL